LREDGGGIEGDTKSVLGLVEKWDDSGTDRGLARHAVDAHHRASVVALLSAMRTSKTVGTDTAAIAIGIQDALASVLARVGRLTGLDGIAGASWVRFVLRENDEGDRDDDGGRDQDEKDDDETDEDA